MAIRFNVSWVPDMNGELNLWNVRTSPGQSRFGEHAHGVGIRSNLRLADAIYNCRGIVHLSRLAELSINHCNRGVAQSQ